MLNSAITNRILDLLKGAKVYFVGGCVRDLALGRKPKDFDFVVVGSSPDDMLRRGFSVHGIEHSVFIHKKDKRLRGFEFSLARREKKVGEGHTGFEFEFEDVTLADDLVRRDLTINAMAIDVGTLDKVDPFNGMHDLMDGRLRHVSEAFAEDPLRVLRTARFAARFGWDVDASTMELCKKLVKDGELDNLTPERVWLELEKTLSEPHIDRFLRVLKDCGALEVVLPELDLYGIEQPPQHHPEVDTGTHLELVMQQVVKITDDPLARWGALVHDVGKKLTPKDVLPHHYEHEKAGVPVVEQLCDRLNMPTDFKEFGMLVSDLHTFVHRCFDMRGGSVVKALKKLDKRGKFLENVDRLTWVAEADARGRTGFEDREYKQAEFVRQAARAYDSVKPRPELVEQIKVAAKKEKSSLGEKLRALQHQDRASAVKAVRREFR